MRNDVKVGVSLRVLYCVVDTDYGLGRSLGDCRPALPKGQKYLICSFIYEKFLLAQGSLLVLCTKFNVQTGAGQQGLPILT